MTYVMLTRIINFFRKRQFEDVNGVLRKRGVVIGENVDIINSYIDGCHGPLVSIGNNVTITGAHILAHDASTKKFLGYTKIGRVTIGNNVFIGDCDEYIQRNRQRLNSMDSFVSNTLFCTRTEEQWGDLKRCLDAKKFGFDL